MLKSQGLQTNQRVEFLTDGGDTVRELPRYLSPESEHWLDWFHITMRLTVMGQMTRGLAAERGPRPRAGRRRGGAAGWTSPNAGEAAGEA